MAPRRNPAGRVVMPPHSSTQPSRRLFQPFATTEAAPAVSLYSPPISRSGDENLINPRTTLLISFATST